MPKVSREKYILWQEYVLKNIDLLNSFTRSDLTGKHYYHFGFIGRKHKIALWRDDELIATGMCRIENALMYLIKWYTSRKEKK